jgi:hypothetical protein
MLERRSGKTETKKPMSRLWFIGFFVVYGAVSEKTRQRWKENEKK